MLLYWGERVLADSWSPLTIAFTHVGTLGFFTMTAIGTFYRIAPERLGRPLRGGRLPLFVHIAFSLGVVLLCIGLAGLTAAAVFAAIIGLFPALCAFFWPAIEALRGTHTQPAARPLRLAIASFVIVCVLGLWVAHGHGGMKFPGPRSLWIQLHVSISLFGWVGGISTAAFGSLSGRHEEGLAALWSRLVFLGISLPAAVLAIDYSGRLATDLNTANWIGALAALPAAIATGWLTPRWGLARLKHPAYAIPAARFWKTGFLLAPVTLALGLLTLLWGTSEMRLLFGWVAIWGWAGFIAHAMLRGETPDDARTTRAYGLHLASLVLGVLAIMTHDPWLARGTGALLLVLASVQWTRLWRRRTRAQTARLPG